MEPNGPHSYEREDPGVGSIHNQHPRISAVDDAARLAERKSEPPVLIENRGFAAHASAVLVRA
jgi:hypothetical protein